MRLIKKITQSDVSTNHESSSRQLLILKTHSCGCWMSHLLNAHPLECSDTARCQLISIVANSQLPISIVAPAVNLKRNKSHPVYHIKFRFLNEITKNLFNITSPLSTRAIEEVCPHVMPDAFLPCRHPVTFLG